MGRSFGVLVTFNSMEKIIMKTTIFFIGSICFPAVMSAPGHFLWDLEDWVDDLHYNATHNGGGGLFGLGIFGGTTTTQAPGGLIHGLWNAIFPSPTTTPAPTTTTTKCGGLIGLGLAC